MPYLKFYAKESKLFPEAEKTIIPDKNISLFAHKITRHFKIEIGTITIRGFGGGSASYWRGKIRLPHNSTALLIIHEIGHIYVYQKLGEHGHTKKLMSFIRRAVRFAEKNNYWNIQQTETEKQIEAQQKKEKLDHKRELRAFTKCDLCGFVSDWSLSQAYNNGHIGFGKLNYAKDSKHDTTCYRCKNRTKQTVIELSYMTKAEKNEFLEKHKSFPTFPLMIFPVSELAVPITTEIMIRRP
jgi:hypothetical protein